MALPRVTPGSYNYGAYANPTPIKYKGGFGEALVGGAMAAAQVTQANRLKEQQDAAKLNKIKGDALDSQLKYKNALYKANPNPGEQTQQSYNELADMWYKNEVDFRTQSRREDGTILDFEGHASMKNKLNNALQISESTANWIKEKANGEMPSITQIRESDKDFKLWSRDKALVSGNFNVSYDEDLNPYIEYYEVDFNKYMDGSYKNIDDIPMNKVSMKMSDIFDDKNLYQPETKYSWEQDEAAINKYAANLAKDAKAFATGARNGYRYLTDNNIANWKTTLIEDFSTDIINTRGKQIYEDILVDKNGERYGYGSWEGTPEQINEVKEAFTNKILEKVPRVYDKLSTDEEEKIKDIKLTPDQTNKLKDFVLNVFPHDKKATTIDMNKIVAGLQEFGLTIEEDPDKPGYQIRSGGTGNLFTVSSNSPAASNLLSITNALGIGPIELTEEDIEFSLYKRN